MVNYPGPHFNAIITGRLGRGQILTPKSISNWIYAFSLFFFGSFSLSSIALKAPIIRFDCKQAEFMAMKNVEKIMYIKTDCGKHRSTEFNGYGFLVFFFSLFWGAIIKRSDCKFLTSATNEA